MTTTRNTSKALRNTLKRNAATMLHSTDRLGYFVMPTTAQRGDDDRMIDAGWITWDRGREAYTVTAAGCTAATAFMAA
jgi:hypothetical protein